ncbi:MAG: ribosome-associated translation inhibitor RaiA [[Eubacterium] siraeum]|nr:ribosome-associated translation inhibitor RaiA [[Eubacterium] siraeum]
MKLQITAKKMQVPQAFNDYAEKKLTKLDRFFGDEADARLTMSAFKDDITIELTVKYENMFFRAEQRAADKNDALDACIDKIIRQIRKNKTKVEKKLKSSAFSEQYSDEVEEQKIYEVVKHKKFQLRPMNVEEAILQMNMLGHSFFMFKNGDTGEVNVVYKRDDGNYAVLEPSKD